MTSAWQLDLMRRFSAHYPIWLCDVWGVVHNGVAPIASAVEALTNHRAAGGKVVFITNAPRPLKTIQTFIDHIGVPRVAYDSMVTSGDVTRALIRQYGGQGLYHLGPEVDLPLFEGLDVKRVAAAEASAILCSGFRDEVRETVADYYELLVPLKQRGLKMICANPDKVVRKGDLLLPCAGAIAELYENMGGTVVMAGKPFAPIYDLALSMAGNPDKSQVLAIGDGPDTDVAGAVANNLACVFISGGINATPKAEAEVRRKYPKANILNSMIELEWS